MAKKDTRSREQKFKSCKNKVAILLKAKGQSKKDAKSGSWTICQKSVMKKGK